MSSANDSSQPATIVILGCLGDLAGRMLVPALWDLYSGAPQRLPRGTRVIGIGRADHDTKWYRGSVQKSVSKRAEPTVDKARLRRFSEKFHYIRGDVQKTRSVAAVAKQILSIEKDYGLPGNRLFYLATPPDVFETAVVNLGSNELLAPNDEQWLRLVIEKPFASGHSEARHLNQTIGQYFDEEQVFRIDHYLGKETTQNLLVFRLGNAIFEPLWNRYFIDHVQITVAETLGIGPRSRTFEKMGTLRDMIENHLLQLLCLVAMEPPTSFDASAVRNEKVKLLHSIKPQSPEEILAYTARGQYGPGIVDGESVPGYQQEVGVSDSLRETYAAWRLEIENWRWAGVPFYLRSGKRLKKKVTEIVVAFKAPPVSFFRRAGVIEPISNQIVFRIQPNEGVELHFGAKKPGATMEIRKQRMDFSFDEQPPSAYTRLLDDALRGDPTLFTRSDEVEASWEHITKILDTWRDNPPKSMPNYAAGTWGPASADVIPGADDKEWREP